MTFDLATSLPMKEIDNSLSAANRAVTRETKLEQGGLLTG
jgi:hypothetical protein